MSPRLFRVLVIALILGAGSAYWAKTSRDDGAVPVTAAMAGTPMRMVNVLATAEAAPRGATLESLPLQTFEMKADQIGPEFLLDTAATRTRLATMTLTRDIPAGSPLLAADFTEIGKAEAIRGMLTPGLLAIAISASPETAVAGLVMPGDRVDVIATRRLPDGDVESSVLIKGCRVLAVDQTVKTVEGDAPMALPTTLTLEASAEGATVIALAREVGTLSVAISTATEMSGVLPGNVALRSSSMFGPTVTAAPQPDTTASEQPTNIAVVRVRRAGVAELQNVQRLD